LLTLISGSSLGQNGRKDSTAALQIRIIKKNKRVALQFEVQPSSLSVSLLEILETKSYFFSGIIAGFSDVWESNGVFSTVRYFISILAVAAFVSSRFGLK
jgi:hypothetical protein